MEPNEFVQRQKKSEHYPRGDENGLDSRFVGDPRGQDGHWGHAAFQCSVVLEFAPELLGRFGHVLQWIFAIHHLVQWRFTLVGIESVGPIASL